MTELELPICSLCRLVSDEQYPFGLHPDCLDVLKDEYQELYRAEQYDFIDSSITTAIARDHRMAEIEQLVDEETVAEWQKEVDASEVG